MIIRILVVLLVLTVAGVARASDAFDQLLDPASEPYRIDGKGFIVTSGHPRHPGDSQRVEIVARFFIDPELVEAMLELDSVEGEEKDTHRYFVRRGRVFQVDEQGEEVDAHSLADLSPATVAALHPRVVAQAALARRENVVGLRGEGYFAWNDELWRVSVNQRADRIERLERRYWDDLFGDRYESIRYENWRGSVPARVVVVQNGIEIARLEFAPAVAAAPFEMAAGNRDRDRARVIAYDELHMDELADHIYKIDIESMNTRVVVAEFADFLLVFEGVYNSRNCDVVAKFLRESMDKPVRYFAFSHLHGQYIGGTRSWVHEGATILVPPTTRPMVEEIAKASFDLQPDVLAQDRKPLRVETIADRRVIEDAVNALEIFNVESSHTDEYFIVYFPRAKVLLTGDLLFYRPGQPLKGRSKLLCETVAKLGIDVERWVATWPLAGYETKNIVTGDEMRAACASP